MVFGALPSVFYCSPELERAADVVGHGRTRQTGARGETEPCQNDASKKKRKFGRIGRDQGRRNPPERANLAGGDGGMASSNPGGLAVLGLGF